MKQGRGLQQLWVQSPLLSGRHLHLEGSHPRVLGSYSLHAVKGADDADPANRTWLEKAVTGPGSAIALAFICNKALMPVRLPITIALTPAVARWVGNSWPWLQGCPWHEDPVLLSGSVVQRCCPQKAC